MLIASMGGESTTTILVGDIDTTAPLSLIGVERLIGAP
jgi:hypothetical protein